MALSIRNPDVERMARELSRQTGETMTDAISGALSDRLALLCGDSLHLRAELLEISAQCAASPDFDTRPGDEILGYADSGAKSLSRLLAALKVEVIAFDSGQAEIALDAWRRYGKGRHAASLNMGDCASYAIASQLHQSLLFKGGDFNLTDVAPALVPDDGNHQ